MDVIAPDGRLESGDGRELRKTVKRSAAASWTPAPNRPDPVAVLAAQDADRVPGLVPLRHARMGVSPFTFYRGAAALMAADLASLPVTGLTVQLADDAHLSNFGVFASPDRSLVFDLNDFDETLRGPWEWDVHRLVTSVVVAGRSRRFSARETTEAALAAAGSYRQAVASFAAMGPLDIFYARLDTAALRATVARRRTKAATGMDSQLAAARKRTSLQAASKLTEEIDGRLRFRADPPVLVPLAGESTGASAKASPIRCGPPTRGTSPASLTPWPSCSDASSWWTWPTRWWGWAASASGRSSPCSRAPGVSRSCCSPRRPSPLCSRPTSRRAHMPATASGWWRARR